MTNRNFSKIGVLESITILVHAAILDCIKTSSSIIFAFLNAEQKPVITAYSNISVLLNFSKTFNWFTTRAKKFTKLTIQMIQKQHCARNAKFLHELSKVLLLV
jgi:hypothetical protein